MNEHIALLEKELVDRLKANLEEANIACTALKIEKDRLYDAAVVFAEREKAKAIKEFAGRLKSRVMKYTEWDEGGWDSTIYAVKVEDIENLVEEMTEE